MIAVFSRTQEDFIRRAGNYYPRNKFILISRVDDVLGRNFDAVIVVPDFYENRAVADAYEELQNRQPELFKN